MTRSKELRRIEAALEERNRAELECGASKLELLLKTIDAARRDVALHRT